MVPRTHNQRVGLGKHLPSPRQLREEFTAEEADIGFVATARSRIRNILNGTDRQHLLMVVGPCSERSFDESIQIAEWLKVMQARCPHFLLVKRTCVAKPRTSLGWEGIVRQPYMENRKVYDGAAGLKLSRKIFLELARMQVPASLEVLGVYPIHCFSDLVSHAWIGARSVGENEYRFLVSGLSMPVGFKNTEDGNVETAVNAIERAGLPAEIWAPNDDGVYEAIPTLGNEDTHVILRGSKHNVNYDGNTISKTNHLLHQRNLKRSIVVDCAHGNCFNHLVESRRPEHQITAAKLVMDDILSGRVDRKDCYSSLNGLMIECDLDGRSITDPCLPLEQTAELLVRLHEQFAETLNPVYL